VGKCVYRDRITRGFESSLFFTRSSCCAIFIFSRRNLHKYIHTSCSQKRWPSIIACTKLEMFFAFRLFLRFLRWQTVLGCFVDGIEKGGRIGLSSPLTFTLIFTSFCQIIRYSARRHRSSFLFEKKKRQYNECLHLRMRIKNHYSPQEWNGFLIFLKRGQFRTTNTLQRIIRSEWSLVDHHQIHCHRMRIRKGRKVW
jgi:hypothetical protein